MWFRSQWVALSPPVEALAFDFYNAAENLTPATASATLPVTCEGVANAIAFWFDLDLDEDVQLSSGPYCQKVGLLGHGSRSHATVRVCCYLHWYCVLTAPDH